jgi:2-polyprenyl-6-methoxyphenol hydroxylase-like FAD-dependent oxidoreductase
MRRVGMPCEIVEIDPEWTVLGVGITLQGPALRALRMIGLLDECVENGFGYSQFKACNADGQVTGVVELPRLNGADYPATIGIMRQKLHSVLQGAVARAGVLVRLGVAVSSLAQDGDGVTVHFTDGTRKTYDLVVGADGTNSKVRALAFGYSCEPKYTGQAVWRAMVSRPGEVLARYSFFGPKNKAGFNPVSDAAMYVYLVQNLPEFIRIPSERLPGVMRELLADFRGPVRAAREEITDPKQIVNRPITSFLLPPPWHRNRIVLIGDAAHTATPQLAAGASIALEDSVVLTQLLQQECSLAASLEKFSARRFARCRMAVENSRQLGEWEKNPAAPKADPVGLIKRSLRELAEPI